MKLSSHIIRQSALIMNSQGSLKRDISQISQSLFTTDNRGNFEFLRSQFMYVDKTQQIYDNILHGDKYYFICRPQRFGKSLVCSTLRELFLGKKELFNGLWIENQWNFEENKHPVIYLDMSSVASKISCADLKMNLHSALNSIAVENNITFDNNSLVKSKFIFLIRKMAKLSGKQVVVIIDEYDAPLLELFG